MLQDGTTGPIPNIWKVDFTTLGYKDISFSSKQRSSSTGPKHFKVQYMLNNNGNWIDLPGTSIITADNWSSGVIVDYMLPTQCNNQNLVSLRWIMTSDTAVNGSPVASTGASRIDDIIVKGLEIPVSISTTITNNILSIYPNPASESIIIELNTSQDIIIYSIDGRCIYKTDQASNYHQINISQWESGIYVIKTTRDPHLTYKFIKY